MAIRVLLCDDVQAFRALMRYVLEEDPRLRVVGEAADGYAVVEEAARTCPDVVVLDLAMPGCDGMSAIPVLLAGSPGVRILVLSGFGAEHMRDAVLASGAHAYLEKGSELDEIRATVHELALAAA